MTSEDLKQANLVLAEFVGSAKTEMFGLTTMDALLAQFSTAFGLAKIDAKLVGSQKPQSKRRRAAEAVSDDSDFASIAERQEAKLLRKIRAIAQQRSKFREAMDLFDEVLAIWLPTILNGEETSGTFRECVAVELGGLVYGCSGVMVHANWVITSAHCPNPSRILIGDDIYDPILGYNEFEVVDRGVVDDKVRVLEVLGAVPNPVIAVVANNCEFAEVQATIVGFGFNEPGGVFGTKRSGRVFIKKSTPIITIPYPNDVCDGDSGGPLIVMKNGKPIVYGLIEEAFQVDCNTGAVYTKLEKSIVDEIENVAGVGLQRC